MMLQSTRSPNNNVLIEVASVLQEIYAQSIDAEKSTATFVDWKEDKMFVWAKMGKGLEWERAEGVIGSDMSDEEKFNVFST
ncbi:unnamed protein product [Onchocerca ochengi]|uniref:Cytochrome p450 n=2 Tax=Onchocerca TaxID=6281 RepID=A0A182DYV4_ONCOC|nr:unnamed protein product [Onchocerca ochengi]